MKSKSDEITIKKLAEIFIPKIWIIALVSVVVSALLGGYSMFIQKDQYTSSGKYNINKVPFTDDESENTGLNSGEIQAMQGMIANMKEIINTLDFCEAVVEKINNGDFEFGAEDEALSDGGEGEPQATADASDDADGATFAKTFDIEPKSLLGMITVSLSGADTTCYYLDATCDDPELAYYIALAAGDHLCELFMDMKYAIEITRIGSPRLPASPDSKHVVRNAVIGFAAGMIVSMVVVFLLSKFDVIVRSREKLESNFDYPILGVIPKAEGNL